jgi:hypothetical protein
VVADPGHLARVQAWPHAQRARAELDAGRPDSALIALAQALAIAPNEPQLHRLQDRVRQALAERQTAAEQLVQREELLRAATAALGAGDPARAAELARQVLALVPDERSATVLLREAEAELEERRLAEAERRTPRATAAAAPATGAPAGSAGGLPGGPAAPAGQVSLRIDFFTELPEGVVTVYAGQRRLLNEPFSFYKRSGLFRREPKAGRIEASRQLDTGPIQLRVQVTTPRESPVIVTSDVSLQAGRTPLLKIHFDRERKLTAVVE